MYIRKQMKQAAKLNMNKNRTQSIIISLLATILGASLADSPSFSFPTGSGGFSAGGSGDFSSDLKQFLTPGVVLLFGFGLVFTILYTTFVAPILKCGIARYFLKYRGNVESDWKELFSVYRDSDWLNISLVTFLTNLSIALWTLLFIIPGIIKAFQYAMVPFILAQNPSIDATRAKQLSRDMMRGHCWEFFVFALSFIGWCALLVPTLFIVGIFHVFPYMNAAYVEFYSVLRADAITNGITTPEELPSYGDDWFGQGNPDASDAPYSFGSGATPETGFTYPDTQPGQPIDNPPLYGSNPQNNTDASPESPEE